MMSCSSMLVKNLFMLTNIETIPYIISPIKLLTIALVIASLSSLFFVLQIRSKFINFNKYKVPLLPLLNIYTILSWLVTLLSVSMIFSIVLYIYGFSFSNSILSAYSIILSTGIIMWFLIVNLFTQFEKGQLTKLEDKF